MRHQADDLAHRLARKLAPLSLTMKHRLAAFPTVTPTGQPAVAPVTAKWQAGPAFDAADDQGRSVKGQVLRHALADAGVQFLDWRQAETGDPGGIGWTQSNTIDSLGHDHGHDLSQVLDQQLDLVAERCRIDFTPPDSEVVAEVRLTPGDSASVVGGPKQPSDPGEIKILIDEDKAAEGTTAYVVLLAADGAVLAQRKTIVGGAE